MRPLDESVLSFGEIAQEAAERATTIRADAAKVRATSERIRAEVRAARETRRDWRAQADNCQLPPWA
jgi:hypothetical protein